MKKPGINNEEYIIIYHHEIEKDISKLSSKKSERIEFFIRKYLKTHPQNYGVRIKRSLRGFWKAQVDDHIIIYEMDIENKLITIMSILKEPFA